MTNRKHTATARIAPVERHRHRYEASTEIVGKRTGQVIRDNVPLVDETQRDEWVKHFTTTATADGHTVNVTGCR